MNTKRHIHLVDDDEAVRHSASFMLRHAGFTVHTYHNGADFLAGIQTADAGCVLLDLRMPVMDGMTVLTQLRERGMEVPVIVLTGHGDVTAAVESMKLGAIDFLEKPYEKQVLLNAVETACDRVEDNSAARSRTSRARARLSSLTPREYQVLERLAGGMTNKTIATDLLISSRTVEIHRGHVMKKLEADSLSSALKIAFQAGIDSD
jgi:two-component system response regulator FixJ